MTEPGLDQSVEVIVEDGVASSKPFILNPQLTNHSKALRRWKLLKTLTIAQSRFNSLTKHEAAFLKAFSAVPPTSPLSADGEQEKEDDCDSQKEARASLGAFLEENSERLTPRERSFLRNLVKSNKATPDYLQTTLRVLEADPLFQQPEDDSEEGKTADAAFGEKEQSSKSIAAQQKHHSAAFRSEVWRRCSSASFGSNKTLYDAKSLRQMATSGTDGAQGKEETEKEQEKVETEKPEEKVSSGFFSNFFFHPTPSSTDEKEEGGGNDNDNAEKEKSVEETYTILGTSVEDEDCHPHVLSPPIMEALRPHLPFTVRQDNFWLKYSMVRDGASMRAMLSKIRSSARTILAIETFDGDVFGGFVSSPWRVNPGGFYGSCEAFLWRLPKTRLSGTSTVEEQIELESGLQVFDWSGKNRNVQSVSGADGELVIGGGGPDEDPSQGGGSGITITADISSGFSEPCLTFESPFIPTLEGKKDPFEIANMEVWSLTPVDNLEQAEQLELGRQFIFDHGNFALA